LDRGRPLRLLPSHQGLDDLCKREAEMLRLFDHANAVNDLLVIPTIPTLMREYWLNKDDSKSS
jgi:hypothetical protein